MVELANTFPCTQGKKSRATRQVLLASGTWILPGWQCGLLLSKDRIKPTAGRFSALTNPCFALPVGQARGRRSRHASQTDGARLTFAAWPLHGLRNPYALVEYHDRLHTAYIIGSRTSRASFGWINLLSSNLAKGFTEYPKFHIWSKFSRNWSCLQGRPRSRFYHNRIWSQIHSKLQLTATDERGCLCSNQIEDSDSSVRSHWFISMKWVTKSYDTTYPGQTITMSRIYRYNILGREGISSSSVFFTGRCSIKQHTDTNLTLNLYTLDLQIPWRNIPGIR